LEKYPVTVVLSVFTLVIFLYAFVDTLKGTALAERVFPRIAGEATNLLRASAAQPIKEQARELDKRLWSWGGVILILIMLTSYFNLETIGICLLPSFCVFVFGGLALEVIVNLRSVIKGFSISLLLFTAIAAAFFAFVLNHDPRGAEWLQSITHSFGLAISPFWSAVVILTFLFIMLSLGMLLNVLLFGMIGIGFVLMLWALSKLSRFLEPRFHVTTWKYPVALALLLLYLSTELPKLLR
jgi:hypothetical protein